MALRIERIFTVIAACLLTTINGDEIWCYTTDSEIRWDYCVSHWDICLKPIIYGGKCQTLPENKNSTHCPNDTSFYWCSPYLALTSILYDLECETYECCPAYLPTTHQSLSTWSSTDSPEHNEKTEACCPPAGLESLVKAQTSLSGQVEGSSIAPNTSAEIATPSSSCNRWTCNLYFVHFVLFMAVFFATTCTKDYL
ncbi:uncharacterized protein LOC132724754 [Ruditapes philippinarum]|uniref:uncharacterized protein LOC132724754 n=1 Tax=Ruditapes philippinarum TaxID=129788 RepID=UPI00295C0AA4|nr:uncharacterized protein LOC132724754 [Ruditapes philippinarum]